MESENNNNMDKINENSGNEMPTRQSLNKADNSRVKKTILMIIGVTLILLIGVWIWKAIEIKSLKKASEKDKIALKEQATRQIVESNEVHLKLLAKPIIWALRSEMMQGNLSQVNLYLNDLVKEKDFQEIVVANAKGTIVSSTNKKDEGQPFSTIGKESSLSSDDTNLENVSDSLLIMTSPIMGFNNRLGTLYIKYSLQKPAFK